LRNGHGGLCIDVWMAYPQTSKQRVFVKPLTPD
jgi:hypothetical protein